MTVLRASVLVFFLFHSREVSQGCTYTCTRLEILRYTLLRGESTDPATPTRPPGVPVNFGSLSPESQRRSIPRTSCFPNTLPSPTLLQISSATGLSRRARFFSIELSTIKDDVQVSRLREIFIKPM